MRDVLYVPKLSYNLLSVTKTSESGKIIKFDDTSCQILNKRDRLIAVATKMGNLYYLQCKEVEKNQQMNVVEKGTKERL